jgi:hypothetical protein
VTDDGYEQTLQVNDLSTGLLGVLALPILEKTSKLPPLETSPWFKPHLTVVTSERRLILPQSTSSFVSDKLISNKNDNSS